MLAQSKAVKPLMIGVRALEHTHAHVSRRNIQIVTNTHNIAYNILSIWKRIRLTAETPLDTLHERSMGNKHDNTFCVEYKNTSLSFSLFLYNQNTRDKWNSVFTKLRIEMESGTRLWPVTHTREDHSVLYVNN